MSTAAKVLAGASHFRLAGLSYLEAQQVAAVTLRDALKVRGPAVVERSNLAHRIRSYTKEGAGERQTVTKLGEFKL